MRLTARAARRLGQPEWLLPAVAALVAIAIIVAVVAGAHLLLTNRTVPVRLPQHGLAGPAGCPSWNTNGAGGQGSASDRMTGRSTGWAGGALRTTDGGTHWHQTAPAEMLADAPPGTSPSAYPPGYVDFFLDSNHAWLAYGYPSATSCFDHVTVFSTADGGQMWKRSQPVNAAVQADTNLTLQIFFIDPEHGWLMVLGSGRIAPDWFVYTTADGGRDWQLLTQMPITYSWCSVEFISLLVGFLGGCQDTSGPQPALTMTRDGGRTWQQVSLPASEGGTYTVLNPTFFDQSHGVIHIGGTVFHDNTSTQSDFLDATDDGGQTWHALPPVSVPVYPQAFAFLDPNHFFVIGSDSKTGDEFIYRSVDAGKTWIQSGTFPPMMQMPPVITFVDGQHGFIDEPSQLLGAGPVALFASSDGGRTWKDMNAHLS